MKRKEVIEAFEGWVKSIAIENEFGSFTPTTPAASEQPTPHGTGPEIAPMVIADIQARVEMGKAKYGEPLRAHNGREALLDAYQEVLDLALYLKQALVERGVTADPIKLTQCKCGALPNVEKTINKETWIVRCPRCQAWHGGRYSTIPLAIRAWNKVQEVMP